MISASFTSYRNLEPGDEVTYEISYRNYKDKAADVKAVDAIDPNVEVVSSDPEATVDGNKATWTIAGVEAGGTGKVQVAVKVKEGARTAGKVENSATVKVGNDKEFNTDVIENPVPQDPTKIETVPYEGAGELGAVEADDEITYEISYKNYKSTGADVTPTNLLDPNIEVKSTSPKVEVKEQKAVWTIKDVPAGTSGKVKITVKVKETTKAKEVANTAEV